MNLKRKIKQLIDPLTTRLLPSWVKFHQNRNDRIGALYKAWGHVINSNMRGAYYEFGIYKGSSFRESFLTYQQYVGWMNSQSNSSEMWRQKIKWDFDHHFYAFDTFEGMPENLENNEIFAKGSFLGSFENVKLEGEKIGMYEGDSIKYFKGLFSEVSKQNATNIADLQTAAIVNIDSDLYMSACDALEIVKPKLQQGAILMMDDWNCFRADNNQGERRALREFLEKNSHIETEKYFSYSFTGQSFIVHIKN